MQGSGLFLSAGFWLVQVGKKVNYPSMLPPTENRCVNLGCSAEASEWVDCTPGRASRIVPNCRSGNVKRRDWSKQNRTTPGHTHSLSSSLCLFPTPHYPRPPLLKLSEALIVWRIKHWGHHYATTLSSLSSPPAQRTRHLPDRRRWYAGQAQALSRISLSIR